MVVSVEVVADILILFALVAVVADVADVADVAVVAVDALPLNAPENVPAVKMFVEGL